MNQHAAAPEFAMSFTQEAVLLERREGLDWRRLGQARFAEGDLAFVLNGLRDDAGGQAGELDTVLVIPEDQILYTSLTVPFGSDTAARIARALEAITPYPAGELVFDWCPAANGDIETLRVAAVTRRTLEEAEDFARAQGFRPSGFQARPGDDRFEGNPDFGPSRLAAEQFNRRPFSEPDLSQARVTAPVIDLTDHGVPSVPVSSRIIPHVQIAATAANAAPVVTASGTTSGATSGAGPDGQTVVGAAAEPGEAATRPVIRHGQLGQVASGQVAPALSPRAQAVHDRAAGARSVRAEPAAEPQAAHRDRWRAGWRPGLPNGWRGLDLTRLPVMVALLAGLLVLGLWFLGRSPDQPQIATAPEAGSDISTTPDQGAEELAVTQPAPQTVADPVADPAATPPAPSELAVAEPGSAPELAQPELPAATDQDSVAPLAQPTQQAALPPEAGADSSAAQGLRAEDLAAESPVAAPTAALPDQGDDALTRALNEALGIASATAPAAAPADPVTQAATLAAALAPATAGAVDAQTPPASGTATADTAPVDAAAVPAESAPAQPAQTTPQPTAASNPPAAAAPQVAATGPAALTASPRPPRAAPARAEATATPDPQPAVPASPPPFAQASTAPTPAATSTRPPARPAIRQVTAPAPAPTPTPAATTPAATTSTATAPATTAPASVPPPAPRPANAPTSAPTTTQPAAAATTPPAPTATAPGGARPPARPANLSLLEEGSVTEGEARRLTEAERASIMRQLRDLRTAQAGATGFTEAERDLVFQLADARPMRKPVAVRAPTQDAVAAAVSEAISSDRPQPRASTAATPPPANPSTANPSTAASATSAPQAGLLARSSRPQARPGTLAARPPSASLSSGAVEEAIAAAVADSPATTPGAVALTALTSSSLPPRRSRAASAVASAASTAAPVASTVTSNAMLATAAPVAAAAATGPSAADLRAAAEAQAADAAMAAQRRQDDELQAQAEARARAQAAADARADAQARAQAEARARAQAEAEARAAAARNQQYRPPEIDNEPDVVAAVPQGAIGNAAETATVKDGIRLNSTQIIGTVGAGQASRALVRLSNGRVLTLRIGDRINGGTITEIKDSRIIYNRNGQLQALGVLNGQ